MIDGICIRYEVFGFSGPGVSTLVACIGDQRVARFWPAALHQVYSKYIPDSIFGPPGISRNMEDALKEMQAEIASVSCVYREYSAQEVIL